MIRYVPDRLRLRKIRSGISACLLRDQMMMNEPSSTTAPTSEATTFVSPQCETPFGLVAALDRPYTRAARPSVPVIAPGRSNRPGCGLESPSARGAARATAMPIGTLTKNTHRQDRYVVSSPPAIRPTAAPAMLIAAYTPIARLRGRPSGNVAATRDSAAAATMAPPAARAALPPRSPPLPPAELPRSEAAE